MFYSIKLFMFTTKCQVNSEKYLCLINNLFISLLSTISIYEKHTLKLFDNLTSFNLFIAWCSRCLQQLEKNHALLGTFSGLRLCHFGEQIEDI